MNLDLDVRLELGATRLHARIASAAPVVGLVGPSGSGKSTLLRVLAGLVRVEGRVSFRGTVWQDANHAVPSWRRSVAWVPQDSALFPHLSVRHNLGYAGGQQGELAHDLDIGHLLERWPRNLSGGERQRVAIGRSLLRRSDLLLLDEPFSALDRPLRNRIASTVRQWCRRQGTTIVVVSHDEPDLVALGAEIWELAGGTLGRRDGSEEG